MKTLSCSIGVAGVLAVLALANEPTTAFVQPKNELQDGIEVQTRGPIHEAFANPVSHKPEASPVIPKKPPEPVNELPPDQKPEGIQVLWIPGYWAFDDERGDYLWVSGIWRAPPPDRHWIPGYWEDVEGGHRWIAGYWGLRTETSIELLPAPPEPVEEAIPPQPSADTIYTPGIWVHRDDRYWWRPGHWITARAGWIWTPAHYCWTPGGYVFVNDYWDYDLDQRGLCFAPAYFDSRILARPGWYYRPNYVVAANFLLSALFVRTGYHHYYFGDYYDATYVKRGYSPWVDYRVHGAVVDPLYGYYRWNYRKDVRWEKELRTVYTTRRENTATRPPRTLALQEKVAADPALRAATSLQQFKSKSFKLETVSKTQVEEIRIHTE